MFPRFVSVIVVVASMVVTPSSLPAITAATTSPATAPTTLPAGRVEMLIDDLTIEYSPADEPFAREFGKWLADRRVEYLKRLDDGSRIYGRLMESSKAADLKFIADELALDAPTKEMSDVYDVFGTKVVDLVKPALRFDRTTIWRASELNKRLASGERVPPFTIDAKGKTTYNWNFHYHGNLNDKLPASQPATKPSEQLIIPVLIKDEDLRRVDRNIERLRQDTLRMLASVADPKSSYGAMLGMFSLMSLHEVTEAALAAHYLKGSDRRWFLDGVANYVAFERLRQKLGTQSADGLYREIYRPEKYAQWLDKVDLEHWPTVETQDEASPKDEFLRAHYYLATETIRAAADYHGPDLLPKVLKELKATPREQATMADVYAAYHKVTGDDLRQVVERTRERLKRTAAAATQATTAPAAP
jgi:hypothetical protein